MEDGWNNMIMFELFDWVLRRFWIWILNVLKFFKGLVLLCENVWICFIVMIILFFYFKFILLYKCRFGYVS